jgi:hypothetical protein
VQVTTSTPEEFDAFIKADIARWTTIRRAGSSKAAVEVLRYKRLSCVTLNVSNLDRARAFYRCQAAASGRRWRGGFRGRLGADAPRARRGLLARLPRYAFEMERRWHRGLADALDRRESMVPAARSRRREGIRMGHPLTGCAVDFLVPGAPRPGPRPLA